MKLLVVDVNGEHFNPMWRNFYNALMFEFDVKWFGPGYVSEKTLEQGVKKFIEKNQGFDFILITTYFYESAIGTKMGNISTTYLANRYLLSKYSVVEMQRFGAKIVKEVDEYNEAKKIIIITVDVATMRKELIKGLRERFEKGYYYLGWGLQFIIKSIDDKMFHGAKLSLDFRKLIEEFYSQTISIPFCAVNESNIGRAMLESRKYDWYVAGNIEGYPQREKMQRILEEQKVNLWNEDKTRSELMYRTSRIENFKKLRYRNWFDKIVVNLGDDFRSNTIYMPTSFTAEQFGGFREAYIDTLKNVKFAYVDGGPVRCLVAKYMEVPASGAVMIGDNVNGLRDLGFINGQHFIELPIEKMNKSVLMEIEENIDTMQEIANNARKLVVEKHTYLKRVELFRKVCERIKQGTYKGGYWKNGDFHFEE